MSIKSIFGGTPSGAAAGDKGLAGPAAKAASGAGRKGAAPSIISADLQIVGDMSSSGDLQVDGAVQGDIRTSVLTIGESAQVRGAVYADTVRVCGSVIGQIEAKRVELTRTARVTGDILHEVLSIELGAYLEGNCRRIDDQGRAREGVVSITDAVPNPLASKKGGAA
ncbi:MAG: bactofilin family protein [Rhodospirillales bacterium]